MPGRLTACVDDPDFQRLQSLRFQHLILPSGCEGFGLLTETGISIDKKLFYADRQHCVFEAQEITNLESPSGKCETEAEIVRPKVLFPSPTGIVLGKVAADNHSGHTG